jgi:Tol biopolymer transport system component
MSGGRLAPPKARASLSVALALLVVLVSLIGPATSQAAFPGANGKIAFQSFRDGNNEIYTMNADGSSQTRLTNNTASDTDPAWSPDGTKIAFATDRDRSNFTYEVYTMNADGSGQTRLTGDSLNDQSPAWSPDGTKIAFATEARASTPRSTPSTPTARARR